MSTAILSIDDLSVVPPPVKPKTFLLSYQSLTPCKNAEYRKFDPKQSHSSVRASLTRNFQMTNCTKFNITNRKIQGLDLPHIA